MSVVDMQDEMFPSEEPTVDLRQYLALLRHWLWMIALLAVLAGAAAYFVSSRQTPIYEATTRVLINEAPSTKVTDYTSVMASERIARTYSELMKTVPVLDGIITKLGLSVQSADLAELITVTPVRDTQLIVVTVEDPDPAQAALIANTLVEVFAEQILANQAERYAASKLSLQTQMDEMQAQIEDLRSQISKERNLAERDLLENKLIQYEQSYNSLALSYEQVRLTEAQTISSVSQVEPAYPQADPVRPKTMQNTLLAAVVGALLGVGGAFLIESLDDSIKNPDDISARFKLPILAMILHHRVDPEGPVAQTRPRSPVTESFRVLRTNVQYAGIGRPIRRLLITSPTPSDGKTTVAANLAVVVAQGGQKVTLIDADLHRPRIHKVMGTSNRFGLSTLFMPNQFGVRDVMQPSKVTGLRVIGSGPIPPNPAEILGSGKMVDIFDRLGEEVEMAIIDTPPTLSVTDAAVLAPHVDAILLVVKPDSTNLTALKSAIEQLRRVGGNVIGVVLNEIETKGSRYSYYYKNYSYYHVYHDGYEPSQKNGHGHGNGGNGGSSGLTKGKAKTEAADTTELLELPITTTGPALRKP